MPLSLIIAVSLHALAAVFWAGTSFTLARTGGAGGERLFRPQMGAATLAVLTGAYIWSQLHQDAFGPPEQVLMIGILTALAAAGVQGALAGPAARQLRDGNDHAAAQGRLALAQRIAAGLLAVTLVCMVIARDI